MSIARGMGTTLSPFRYLQLARYVLQRFLDSPHLIPGKGKGPAHARPVLRSLGGASAKGSVFTAAALDSRDEADPEAGQGHAGPSNLSLGSSSSRYLKPDPKLPPEPQEIYRLMNDERLFIPGRDNAPNEIVVLCHGLYGFSTATPIPLFPSLKLHYWGSVLEGLREKMGVKVVVVGVKGTGSIKERAEQMHDFLKTHLPKGTGVNFVAHSMGGLDVRHLISIIKPTTYTPLSLTSIGTPHRGSPFMDWCANNIGVGIADTGAAAAAAELASAALGSSSSSSSSSAATSAAAKALPFSLKSPLFARPPEKTSGSVAAFSSSLTSYFLNIFDSPAYGNLTTSYLRDHFNPRTEDSPHVKYFSVAGRTRKMSVLHPLWFPKLVLDTAAEKGYAEDFGATGNDYEGNDGLVSISSAKWGNFLGAVDPCHHWDLRGEGGLWPNGAALDDKPSGKPDKSVPGGWDWKGRVKEDLGLSSSSSSSSSGQSKAERDADKVKHTMESKSTKSDSSSSWDVAQVGQVLDWVMDILPGGQGSKTQSRSLEAAKKEKRRDEDRLHGRAPEVVEGKYVKDKFDLARFYGGLMLNLRDEGL